MPRIKQLPLHEAQKIAAGEVVDRPANVVKELIENAIDAGATQIALHIVDGGKELIRVVDNGCGMSLQDARLCFLHHATSKITSVHDLPNLATFGFRGEALSSISAVSKVTLVTKEDGIEGAQLILEAGIITDESVVPCVQGTDITVENLFYNVPARKKFLKTRDTEWRQIVNLFHAFVLDYQSIHFKMFSEGAELYNCPPVLNLSERFMQLWDSSLHSQLISIVQENADYQVRVHGVITNHQYYRYDRSCMFFFVNNRWVKNQALSKAVMKGYLNVIPADRFPAAALFISIDSHQVDINIHPRKEEVQFLHPRAVETLITQAVKQALENNLSAQIGKKVSFFQDKHAWVNAPALARTDLFVPEMAAPFIVQPVVQQLRQEMAAPLSTSFEQEEVQHTIAQSTAHGVGTEVVLPHFTIIGQFNKTYILIEQEDGLFLVDQHAAHERILYEQFANRFENNQPVSLLFPITIALQQDDLQLLEMHFYLFKENGIVWERISAHQIAIVAVPVFAKEISFNELVHQAIGWLKEYKAIERDRFEKLINEKLRAQMACKAAVKAGDTLTHAQMEQLLADLTKTPQRFTCPHGRPTGWLLSLNEIERKFKRKL